MRRYLIFGVSAALLSFALQAATLERLTLDDMIQKSTAIVRGRIGGSSAAPHGSLIYTHYQVRVEEQWKGEAAGTLDVVVPGGTAGGLRQSFPGAPKPRAGAEYILFLWKSPATGLTHIIGLSQGLLKLEKDAGGELVASRTPGGDVMLDAQGNVVKDEALRMPLTDLRTRVAGGRK